MGLLGTKLHRWKQLGLSKVAVWDIMEGHEIVFKDGCIPPRTGMINTSPGGSREAQILDAELKALLTKGAVEVVPLRMREEGFYSQYFLVPKKDGGFRPILNLKPFNKFVAKASNKFRMLRTPVLLSMVKQSDWLTSVDLKDAFQHVPVAARHRKYFRFRYREECYQYTRLPFGYSLSPLTFTRCLKAALVVLLRRGLRLAWYLDDLLVMANSPEQAMRHTHELIEYLEYVGFTINYQKSTPWPARQITYLGLRLDSVSMSATLSQERWLTVETVLALFHPGACVTYLACKRLLGLLCAAHQVVPLGLLFLRRLQRWFASLYSMYGDDAKFNSTKVQVPIGVEPDLAHWRRACSDRVGMPLGPKDPLVTIFTDACNTGWGAILGHKTVSGAWGGLRHINDRETEAIWLALQHFAPVIKGSHVLVMTDSMTARAVINRQGDLKSGYRMDLARSVWLWTQSNLLSLTAGHIPGVDNVAADILSRGGPRDDEWSLNPIIVSMIWERFGVAQVDLFARKCNRKCQLWYSICPSDRAPLGVNAFGPGLWPRETLYAFPPVKLLLDLVVRFEKEGGRMILVAPVSECSG